MKHLVLYLNSVLRCHIMKQLQQLLHHSVHKFHYLKGIFYCKSIQQKFLKPQNVLKKWLSSSKLVGTSSKRSLEVCFRSILLWLYMNILLFNGNTFFQLFRDIKFYYSTNQHGTILEVKQILVLALAAEKRMYQLGGRKSFECLSQKP